MLEKNKEINQFLNRVIDLNSQVFYFPVRHHSPVCSLKLQEIIREFKPEHILIEGPYDFNSNLGLLTDEATVPPFAIYSFFIDKDNKLGKNGILTSKKNEPARYRCWYPFTDYSPELVAMRDGKKISAKVTFIDLPYPEMVSFRGVDSLKSDISPKGKHLFDDYLVQQSNYVKMLCNKKGCRNYNDLWDTLFEVGGMDISPTDFVRSFLLFCYLSRVDYPSFQLEAEGCIAREQFMAANICRTLSSSQKVLVVTGGFHTVTLPDLVDTNPAFKEPLLYSEEIGASYLTRYSFELLDRNRGYESGMPSPAYYQEVWTSSQKEENSPFSSAALKFIIEIARKVRKEGTPISTSESIEAYSLALNLSRFRNRSQISREDLLDGIKAAFVKGSLSGGGYKNILNITNILLRGYTIGSISASAGQPPIVRDFYSKIKKLSLQNLTSQRKDIKLDLYRKGLHRKKSQFLHSLKFLSVPYGYLVKGPDFIRGKNLNLLFEMWEIIWNPSIESVLIEKALYGTTIFDASNSLLREKLSNLENKTSHAASLLLDACRMGLQSQIGALLHITSSILYKDQDFSSLVSAASALCLIYKYRDALEAKGLETLLPVIHSLYNQIVILIQEIPSVNEEKEKEIFNSFQSFHYLILSFKEADFDKVIYIESLKRGLEVKDGRSLIRGSFTGVLFSCGEITEEEVSSELMGYLKGSPEYILLVSGFIEGLLVSAKHIFFETSVVFKGLHSFLEHSNEKIFLTILPGLRRAFTVFTPRETEIIANKIARFTGILPEILLENSTVAPCVTSKGIEIDRKVTDLMKKLGLLREK